MKPNFPLSVLFRKKPDLPTIAILAALTTLSACGSNKEVSDEPNEPEVASEVELKNTSELAVKSQTEKASDDIESPFPEAPKNVLINGNKMTVSSIPLTKGDFVYDHSVKENGQVTGSLVAVLKPDATLPSAWSDDFTIEKLSDRTYKLTPTEIVDLVSTYKLLFKSSEVEKVEITVFYGPTNSPETM